MSQELELTPAQEEEIGKIFKARTENLLGTVMEMGNMTREERREKLQKMMEDTDNDIKGILNSTQAQKYEEMKESQGWNQMPGGGWGRRGGQQPQDPRGY